MTTTTVLVTATGEGSGKTAVALALATLARERGRSVGYMKPKGTRLESVVGKTVDADPAFAAELLDIDADVATLEPVVYSPTFVEEAVRGREDPGALREQVRESFETLSADRDLMVVEGGTTWATGRTVDLADPAVATLLDADPLVVAGYHRPDDLDDILVAADRFDGPRVLFNGIAEGTADRVAADVAPFLEGEGIPVPGVLPRVPELAGVTVADLAEELGAEVLTDGATDATVERFLVGAMGAETSLRYFRRASDAAVITGGDRAEIHSVALEAPGVRCLLLTGGVEPSDAVLGTAETRGIPVLLVRGDTMTTIDRAEGVVRSGRTRDARTVERMRELLADHADVDALLGG
jgi:BioD-like phosphotransacetylase family protein